MEFLKTLGWRQENSFADDSIVTINVEDSDKVFHVHKHILDEKFGNFPSATASVTARETPILLSLVTAECFETVSRWLYSNDLVLNELENDGKGFAQKNCKNNDAITKPVTDETSQYEQDYIHVEARTKADPAGFLPWYSDLNQTDRIFARLVDLYALACTYDAPRLKAVVMLTWQRFSLSSNKLPAVEVVNRAFSRIHNDAPLCNYIILWYGYFADQVAFDASTFSSSSPRFLAGVLDIMYQKQAGTCRFDGLDQNWCDFHEHCNRAEVVQCQKLRKNDPDVVAKRAEEQWNGISAAQR